MEKIDVLDHGFVRLVDSMGDDLSIVRAARVSYAAAWRAGEEAGSDARLINYLWKNQHSTPFESVEFQFEVMAPIFVLRQWMRHRTWCIGGNARLVFERPCDGTAYRMRLDDLVRKMNPTDAKRRRRDQSPMSQREFNRARIAQMGLRGPSGDVHIQDAWYSGQKETYQVKTKYGSVEVSEDHVFKTPNGPLRLKDGLRHINGMVRVGGDSNKTVVPFSEQELMGERWKPVADGYDVSDLGRVRSYWGQGKRVKSSVPALKTLSLNGVGRSVVTIAGSTQQVSGLVVKAFLGEVPEGHQVLHIDDVPQNNRLSNLYIGTAKDNAKDQYKNGGRVRLREVDLDVIDVSKIGMQDTFDITVDGDHWFCVDNLVVHNSFNELSGRYRELPELFYIPDPHAIGVQSTSNKQGREEGGVLSDRIGECAALRKACDRAFDTYRLLLDRGWPRELARTVLPLNTYSHMFAKVNLRNLLAFLDLRIHEHAQFEIREYAGALVKLIQPIVPVAIAAWEKTPTVMDLTRQIEELSEYIQIAGVMRHDARVAAE